jgi:hypothetical protein
MYTIIETEIFQRYAADIWRDAEREASIAWLANNPLSEMSFRVLAAYAKYGGQGPEWENVAAHE